MLEKEPDKDTRNPEERQLSEECLKGTQAPRTQPVTNFVFAERDTRSSTVKQLDGLMCRFERNQLIHGPMRDKDWLALQRTARHEGLGTGGDEARKHCSTADPGWKQQPQCAHHHRALTEAYCIEWPCIQVHRDRIRID
jgi:hypothetical protein